MKISILGCGWLGLSLAEHLIQRNHTIKGSTTSKEKMALLNARAIEPYLLQLNPTLSVKTSVQDFWKSDALVLNIPPGRKKENVIDYHTRQIQSVIEAVSNSRISFIIFISSTSVYPSLCGAVTEMDAVAGQAARASGNALLQVEKLLMASGDFKTTIVRFGGLIGGDRNPAKYLAGRSNLPKANAPVNLIHRDDCIRIITQIIEQDITGAVFNAVSDHHPTRQEYYTKVAKILGLEPPVFSPDHEEKNYKVVLNEKLKNILNYQFQNLSPWRART